MHEVSCINFKFKPFNYNILSSSCAYVVGLQVIICLEEGEGIWHLIKIGLYNQK